MSWLFSQALVAEYSAVTCSDGGQSAPSKSSHIPQAYCSPDRMTEFSRLSRYGMTFAPLTADRGEALLTSYLAGFRARTSASPEKGLESPESAADCGQKWRGLLARFDRSTSSWKTAQLSLLGDSEQSSVIWPRSGMTAGGQCWELPTLGHRTRGIDCGLLPTPTKTDANGRTYYYSRGDKKNSVPSLLGVAKLLPTPAATDWKGVYTWDTVKKRMAMSRGVRLSEQVCRDAGKAIIPNPEFWEWIMGWPVGSTGLLPLETGKFLSWLQQHGGC